MLRRIVTNSVELVKFVFALGLSLSRPQQQHVLNLAGAILVSEERKTIANLNRQLVEAKDDSSVHHTFRDSPWQAYDIQLLKAAAQLALQCGSIAPVLSKFVRPFSALTSPAEVVV